MYLYIRDRFSFQYMITSSKSWLSHFLWGSFLITYTLYLYSRDNFIINIIDSRNLYEFSKEGLYMREPFFTRDDNHEDTSDDRIQATGKMTIIRLYKKEINYFSILSDILFWNTLRSKF